MNNKLKRLNQQIKTKLNNLYTFRETLRTLDGKYITISYNCGYDDIFSIDFKNNNLRIELKTISSVIDFIQNNIPDDYTSRMDLFPIMQVK